MKVLITGARAPVAIDLLRAFRAAGDVVELADCIHPWAAYTLRPSAKIHRYPAPAREFDAFATTITELVERHEFELVVPTCEEVFWLAAAAARGQWGNRLFAPDLGLLRRLHSKLEFPRLLTECGLMAPQTQCLEGPPDPEQLPPLESLVFKPEFSRFGTHTLISPLAASLTRVNASSSLRWAAQEKINGVEICSWAVLNHGKIVAHVTYRPRWRYRHTAAYGMEAIDCPAAEAVAKRIGEMTSMTGQIAFDFIIDHSGQVWPIECNPRSVSGLHFFDADATLAKAIACGRKVPSPASGLLRHMTPAMVFLGIPSAIAAGRLGVLWADWCKGCDVIARGHPQVGLGSLIDATYFAGLALVKRMSPTGATTDGIEWNGQAIP
ncbi:MULTISPECIES: hypothetical protein [Acidithiobacillus]|uniref:hypothetical protein n=1 Tax=Acidithiobacillus TaxID=119977 RepID=UPI00094AD9D6|nr:MULTISPECIES: hypothetical protein [Acidithiobacillus]MDD5279744.1 hypothetical protein [Acidithiobacillus sp.]